VRRTQAARTVPLEEVPERAQTTRAELDAIRPREASRQRLERIGAELDRTLPEVASRLAKTRDTLADRPNARTLQAIEAELSRMRERLRPAGPAISRISSRTTSLPVNMPVPAKETSGLHGAGPLCLQHRESALSGRSVKP